MKLVQVAFFIGAVLFGSSFLIAQEKIKKKDEAKIQETCEIFIRHSDSVIANIDVPLDSLRNVTSELALHRLLLIRDFIHQMDYDNISFYPKEVVRLELTDSIGCILNTDPEMKLNVRKEAGGWEVFGYDNQEVDKEAIEKTKAWIAKDLAQEDVKDSIQDILQQFVDGWSEMRQFEKSDLLKSLSTSVFHDYISTNVRYEHLQGYGDRPVEVKEIERVQIHEDTAWCRVGIKGMGGARFVLLLQNNEWKVAGLNDEVYTSEDVTKIEDRITEYLEIAKFVEYTDEFNDELEAFFKTGNSSPLKVRATDQLIDQLEIYRRLSGTIDTAFLNIRGIRVSSLPSNDFTIYGDTAYYDYYYDSVRWIKLNDKWLVDEFFASLDINNNYDKAQQTFREFNDLIDLSYNWFNTLDENEPPPPIAVSSTEPDYTKVKQYHRLNDYHAEIIYETGNDQLCEDLRSLTKKASSKTSFKGVIYVEFKVDNLGNAQNIRALDHDSEAAKIAEEIVGQLGNWIPNDRKQSSLTNMVVAIQF